VAGECQFALVAGEAGIGKSRLLDELERLAAARRYRVLHGRFVEHDQSFPYQGFCDAILEFMRGRVSSSSSGALVEFGDLAEDLVRLFPSLAEVASFRSVASEARPPEARDVHGDRTYVFEVLARALTRVAGGRPLVLLLEDLHDADISIHALQYIVRRLGPTPTLIVGCYRPSNVDRRHPLSRLLDSFRGDRRFSHIVLGPLANDDHRLLVETLVGTGTLTPGTARKLYEATEGNPFFTRELVRSLVDSGGIAEDDAGTLQLSSDLGVAAASLPETILQMVEKQIEQLTDELKDILGIASLLGRGFDYRDLEALADKAPDLEDDVERLIREGFLQEERESRGDRLAFTSGVVRDVLYAALSRRRRRALHRKYAEYLEKRHAGRLERVYPQLAHHYAEADVAEKAVQYGMLAARSFLDAYGAEDATRSLRTVLEFIEDELLDNQAQLEGQARILLARAMSLEGNFDGAIREAARAVQVTEHVVGCEATAIEALVLAANIGWEGRRVEEVRRWINRGLALARRVNAIEPLTHLLRLGATEASLRGEYALAREYHEEIERIRPVDPRGVPRGGRLRVGMSSRIEARDPALARTPDEREVLSNVYETLFSVDERGAVVPALCESWEMLEAGWAFRLTLRRDLRFSNGEPVSAAAVAASLARTARVRAAELPAALASIRGIGDAGEYLTGIEIESDEVFTIHLTEAVPLFPSLLADPAVAIVRDVRGELLGIGPFRIEAIGVDRVVLERNVESHESGAPNIDAIEFRAGLSPAVMALEFRTGNLDLAHDLAPEDMERLTRDQRLRSALVEAPRRNTCFVVFNTNRVGETLRNVLCLVVRAQDLVWRNLGRLGIPATGLLPPGLLGHDAGRRFRSISADEAARALAEAGIATPLELRAVVPHGLQDRHGQFISALVAEWRPLGLEVAITPADGARAEALLATGDFDLAVTRCDAAFGDPDRFTYGLFHSRHGLLRNYFSSPEFDDLVNEARVEGSPGIRDSLYRKIDSWLIEHGVCLPLFHETDYRLIRPSVRGARLSPVPPYVNYTQLARIPDRVAQLAPVKSSSVIQVGTSAPNVSALDPVRLLNTDQYEVVPNVFETLLRIDDGARAVPWLAADYRIEAQGTRYRFRLRDDVRFQDGRRLTARDVRYSFERLLQQGEHETRWLLSPIRGAAALANGEAGYLEGLRIISASEFTLELEQPLSFFAVLLTNPATAIIPEGATPTGSSWTEGLIGTGPFRVTQFEPGTRLQFERNPDYWRSGFPRSDGLVFNLGMPVDEIASEFRAGRLAIASELALSDLDELRSDPAFAGCYYESARLSTAYVAFNARSGPLRNVELRRRLVGSIDLRPALRRHLRRYMLPATGLVPPGLVGHRPSPRSIGPMPSGSSANLLPLGAPIELRAVASSSFVTVLKELTDDLFEAFGKAGLPVKLLSTSMPELARAQRDASVDVVLGIWVADYPDTDSFVGGLLHSRTGLLEKLVGSPALDALIERGRVVTDPMVRHTIYSQIEELLATESLLMPLFHPYDYRFAQPKVDGMSLTSLRFPNVPYDEIWIR
jgi:ABC-type transport system substrate-binding protein